MNFDLVVYKIHSTCFQTLYPHLLYILSDVSRNLQIMVNLVAGFVNYSKGLSVFDVKGVIGFTQGVPREINFLYLKKYMSVEIVFNFLNGEHSGRNK